MTSNLKPPTSPRALILSDSGDVPPLLQEALNEAGLAWGVCCSVADLQRADSDKVDLLILREPPVEATWQQLAKLPRLEPGGKGGVISVGRLPAEKHRPPDSLNVMVLDESIGARNLASILRATSSRSTSSTSSTRAQTQTTSAPESGVRAADGASGQGTEEEVRIAQLEATVKSLERFCYTVAHDLRAPLRAVQGLATALLEDYGTALTGDGLDYARRIVTAAARMDRLIVDLLTYNRLDQLEITSSDLNLDLVLDVVLGVLSTDLKAAEAELHVARPLPGLRSHQPVVEQVLSQLLSNAIKFVAPGTKPIIKIRAEEVTGNLRVWVEDNGIGIDPRHHQRIFNVFERLHGEETYPGTGIGLALVRKGMQRLGGNCGVESALGAGSKFWLDFPKSPRSEPAAPAPNTPRDG